MNDIERSVFSCQKTQPRLSNQIVLPKDKLNSLIHICIFISVHDKEMSTKYFVRTNRTILDSFFYEV